MPEQLGFENASLAANFVIGDFSFQLFVLDYNNFLLFEAVLPSMKLVLA